MMIRLATPDDLSSLLKLSAMLPPGMTSMPFDKPSWEKKLEVVERASVAKSKPDEEAVYFLVMESDEGDIVGTAGIVAGVGLTRPFYNYKLTKDFRVSEQLGIRVTSNLLNLVNDFTGETELVSLYLMPEHRKQHAGQFMSRCRFLFMSDFPERFSDLVFAEIRGWLDEREKSPFWECLGSKFFNLPFAKADFISAVNGSQFISDLMPRFPVYVELLPQQAIDVIGKAHDGAVPAIKILEREGFAYQNMVDVFDAGPVLQCERTRIKSISESRTVRLDRTVGKLAGSGQSSGEGETALYIVSNKQLPDYRLIVAELSVNDELAEMTTADADRLHISVGDSIQILPIRQ
jgi:arginine N-succinyltransferase